jgi:putative transcriptional regulator
MLDLSFKNSRFPKKGSVLLSDPFMEDNYFSRSVIILCDYSKEGAFGFVLTNYLDLDLMELDSSFPVKNAKISVGGPVDNEHIFYVHQFGNQVDESIQIMDELYFGGNYNQLQEKIHESEENQTKVRFFLGYSGWSSEQLIDELKENSWIVVNNINADEIIDTSKQDFWKYCMEKQGDRYKIISKFPKNPNEN